MNLTWFMHRRIDEEALPDGRVVLELVYTAPKRTVIWMVLDRGEASVCLQHPGFDPDLVVTTTTPVMAEVFSGFDTWHRAAGTGAIEIEGPPNLVRRLPKWFTWSPFADETRAMAGAAAAG